LISQFDQNTRFAKNIEISIAVGGKKNAKRVFYGAGSWFIF
jgi:hypothetical protein